MRYVDKTMSGNRRLFANLTKFHCCITRGNQFIVARTSFYLSSIFLSIATSATFYLHIPLFVSTYVAFVTLSAANRVLLMLFLFSADVLLV
uniref:Uncharacterized protein n=1 Tax=Parascaris univalens TaxID=6257 RepID=A0A915A3S7_PARUN